MDENEVRSPDWHCSFESDRCAMQDPSYCVYPFSRIYLVTRDCTNN